MMYVSRCCKTREQFNAALEARGSLTQPTVCVKTPAGESFRRGSDTGQLIALWINAGESNGVRIGGHGVIYG